MTDTSSSEDEDKKPAGVIGVCIIGCFVCGFVFFIGFCQMVNLFMYKPLARWGVANVIPARTYYVFTIFNQHSQYGGASKKIEFMGHFYNWARWFRFLATDTYQVVLAGICFYYEIYCFKRGGIADTSWWDTIVLGFIRVCSYSIFFGLLMDDIYAGPCMVDADSPSIMPEDCVDAPNKWIVARVTEKVTIYIGILSLLLGIYHSFVWVKRYIDAMKSGFGLFDPSSWGTGSWGSNWWDTGSSSSFSSSSA